MNARKLLVPALILVVLFWGMVSNVMAASPASWSGTVGGVNVTATKYVHLPDRRM